MRTLTLLSLALLAACTGTDAGDKDPVDADGDGYFDAADGTGDDCDDADAAVNPGAAEVCGGGDEDCDTLVDEADDDLSDASAWYPDLDGDTYGDDAAELLACAAPDGAIATPGDCDDTRADVSPTGSEVCDDAGADEDCDGLANDDDAGVAGQSPWYADADGDGYGSEPALLTCTPPEGYVLELGDCDDANPAVNPDGAEVCDAADADEDCDGAADDADTDVSGLTAFYPDADADGWGAESATLRCDASLGETANAGDCDDTDPALNGDDADGDGESTCDGDCDDTDVEITRADCEYATMVGTFDVESAACVFDIVGVARATPSACPDCEFAFDSTATLASGSCISTFEAEFGWDEDTLELDFSFTTAYTYGAYSLGSFPGTITAGADYDILEWYGLSVSYQYYGGTFFLYR